MAAPLPTPHGPIALVALDLDGTLLDSHKRIAQPVVDAVGRALRRGVYVVLATARPPRSVRQYHVQLGLATPTVNYNGALVWDEATMRPLLHQPLAADVVGAVVETARDYFDEVLVSVEHLDRWATDRFDSRFLTETARTHAPDVVCAQAELCAMEATKLLLQGEPYMLDRLEALLTARFFGKIEIVRTEPELLQFMRVGCGKSKGLIFLCDRLGIARANVMAVGDQLNDVGMLQWAGVGVATGNAHPQLRAVADWVAPTNDEEAVRAALERFVLT